MQESKIIYKCPRCLNVLRPASEEWQRDRKFSVTLQKELPPGHTAWECELCSHYEERDSEGKLITPPLPNTEPLPGKKTRVKSLLPKPVKKRDLKDLSERQREEILEFFETHTEKETEDKFFIKGRELSYWSQKRKNQQIKEQQQPQAKENRKRRNFTIEEKKEIIEFFLDNNEEKTLEKYDVKANMVWYWRNKQGIMPGSKNGNSVLRSGNSLDSQMADLGKNVVNIFFSAFYVLVESFASAIEGEGG